MPAEAENASTPSPLEEEVVVQVEATKTWPPTTHTEPKVADAALTRVRGTGTGTGTGTDRSRYFVEV